MATSEGFLASLPVDENDKMWKDYLHAKHVDFAQVKHLRAEKFAVLLPAELAGEIASDFEDVQHIAFTGDEWVQFACENATKWKAVEASAKYLGIETAQIAAFGDDFNDLEMIEKCGVGVAMGNAIPEVLAVADFVTADNNNDGIAVWIEENIL